MKPPDHEPDPMLAVAIFDSELTLVGKVQLSTVRTLWAEVPERGARAWREVPEPRAREARVWRPSVTMVKRSCGSITCAERRAHAAATEPRARTARVLSLIHI